MSPQFIKLIFLVLVTFSSSLLAESNYPFVNPEFKIPKTFENDRYRLRMLSINDAVKDYDAVMSSTKHLQQLWGADWPKGHTLEQNLIDLGWHQYEFQSRNSFAYAVVSLDESRILGNVYINPTRKRGYDAAIHFWARESELSNGIEDNLKMELEKWLKAEWPFKKVAFPGREIQRAVWLAIPDVKR